MGAPPVRRHACLAVAGTTATPGGARASSGAAVLRWRPCDCRRVKQPARPRLPSHSPRRPPAPGPVARVALQQQAGRGWRRRARDARPAATVPAQLRAIQAKGRPTHRVLPLSPSLTARSSPNVSYAHVRTERMHLTAAIPLFAMSTLWMARMPPLAATNSSTLSKLGRAVSLRGRAELAAAIVRAAVVRTPWRPGTDLLPSRVGRRRERACDWPSLRLSSAIALLSALFLAARRPVQLPLGAASPPSRAAAREPPALRACAGRPHCAFPPGPAGDQCPPPRKATPGAGMR
mmetsp:Transcript_10356/g.40274  ORF Transcript_10356/g.40274 Transcript_10356/m.40274 type:complete len:291 (+) Transcript_10356:91-963(+)